GEGYTVVVIAFYILENKKGNTVSNFFFFKQKTAYEVGLGIPAEPLFRSPNVFEMAATETITSIILIKLIRVSLGTVRHPRRFKIVVIDIQITLKQMLRDFIGIRVNRAK